MFSDPLLDISKHASVFNNKQQEILYHLTSATVAYKATFSTLFSSHTMYSTILYKTEFLPPQTRRSDQIAGREPRDICRAKEERMGWDGIFLFSALLGNENEAEVKFNY